ncbi:MAG: hypothetical protein ACFFHV_15090 [Promethearchaeota archaeon]
MVINKLKKELKSRRRINKEQDYIVSSIVKEPSFLKKGILTKIEHRTAITSSLKEKQAPLSVKFLFPNMEINPEDNEIDSKITASELEEWKKSKKFYKSLNKSIKKLEWIKYNLQIKSKRIKSKNIANLSQSLRNAIKDIEVAINEMKIGVNKTKNLPVRNDLQLYDKRANEFRHKDVFETKIYLIRMNIKPESIVNTLKMVFLRKKIVFLMEDNLTYLKDTINHFFNAIFRNSFDIEILSLTKTEYNEFRDRHKDFIVITGKKILVNDGKENYVKNCKFEKKLVDIFFKNSDPLTGLKILRKELQEIYDLSNEIRDFSALNDNKLSRRKMLKHLEQVFFLKVKKNYFNILLGIVNTYFNKKIKFSEDYIEEKIDTMWR